MSGEPLTLTLDIGTSSTRVLLWDTQGREVETVRAQIKYQMHTTPDGGMEMPAEELEKHVGDCLDQAMTQVGDRAGSIAAVGVSTFWHAILGLAADGKPLTPIYNWADQRAGGAARELRSRLDEHAVHQRTGCVLHSSYYPAKLTWLQQTQPDVYKQVARWASPSEYLFGRWFGTGARNVSLSMASGTGLLNQQSCTWDAETLAAIGLSAERLAPIVDLSERAQGLQGEFTGRWSALKDVPFFPAVGDGACGNVGSGCNTPTKFAINLGTSGAIRALWSESAEPKAANKTNGSDKGAAQPVIASQPIVIPGLWRYRVDSRRPLIGAAFSDGGIVYDWMTRTLQLPPADQLEKLLAAMPPGEHGLTFLPFLGGERSLGWNPDARAALTGMNLDTSPIEMLRAGMEAVAMRFALAAQRLQSVFPQLQQIVASGGALGHSPCWSQMFADAIGRPVTLAAEAEASSRGAALLAMQAAGLITHTSDAEARLGKTYIPDPARHIVYQQMLVRQQAQYAMLITPQGHSPLT